MTDLTVNDQAELIKIGMDLALRYPISTRYHLREHHLTDLHSIAECYNIPGDTQIKWTRRYLETDRGPL